MNRFASTRSENWAVHSAAPRAQWSVGSVDADGIRYGFTTHALMASTIATAPTIVTTQSIATLHGRGRRCVNRSTGLLTRLPRLLWQADAPPRGGSREHIADPVVPRQRAPDAGN